MIDGHGEQAAEAFRAQIEHARASHAIDRRGWTREQWIADAEQQMNDLHGSVIDLVNGHVMALLAEVAALRATVARQRVALTYIARPSMGLPSGVDPASFARHEATEANVRAALAIVINMARAALAPPADEEHDGTDRGGAT